jgi:glutathione S-transferase
MKLRYSPTSPYVRKVTVTAAEKGLADRIERVLTNVWDPASDIGALNPLGKVPALVADDGTVLYDSPVICEYLDRLAPVPRLLAEGGRERWTDLTLMALADGILDAGVARLLELRRPDSATRSEAWMARQWDKVVRGLDALERQAAGWTDAPTLGRIGVGCALGWLDFRFGAFDWRTGRPRLAGWSGVFARRPSMRDSEPKEA